MTRCDGRWVGRMVLAVSAVVLSAALVTLPASGASPEAHSAGTSVTLNLHGGYANHTVRACGITHHYTYFRPRRTISYSGTVSPAPSGSWQVKLKLKKCVRGRFVTVFQTRVSGRSGGRFSGSFRRSTRGFYFARAYYYGVRPAVRSDKEFFRIR
jgi:hypothetical protein